MGAGVSQLLKSFGLGYSATNGFEVTIPFYNGEGLFDYTQQGTFFVETVVSIESEKLHSSLEGWFTLEFTGTRTFSVISPTGEADEEEIRNRLENSINATTDEADAGIDNIFSDWTIQSVCSGK